MKNVLVTGANGFVGSHICESLVASGSKVRGMVRETSDLSNLQGIDMDIVYGDLNDYDSLLKAVKGIDAVVNNAGLTKTLDPEMFEKVNKEGPENLLKACHESGASISKFIQISSAAAYGPSDSGIPVNEKDIPKPLTLYGKSKLNGERIVLDYKDKIPVVILRPSAVYGPRDKEMLSFFKIINYRIKPTFGSGECYINFTYVKDLAAAVPETIRNETESGSDYFISEKKTYSYSEAGDIISAIIGKKALDIHIPTGVLRLSGKISGYIAKKRKRAEIFTEDKALELAQKFWIIDSSRIERDLGFVSKTSFKEGAADTVAWYREHGWL